MKYVRGYVVRQHGPFVAKEKFDGFANSVFEHPTHYIIQGIRIEKEQIELVADVSVTVETLDMPVLTGAVKRRTRKPKKVTAIRDEHDERFDSIKIKWDEVLQEAVRDAKRYKRVLSPIVLDKHNEAVEAIEESMKFARVTKIESQKYSCCERLFSLYINTIYEVDNSPTEKQYLKELTKQFAEGR